MYYTITVQDSEGYDLAVNDYIEGRKEAIAQAKAMLEEHEDAVYVKVANVDNQNVVQWDRSK